MAAYQIIAHLNGGESSARRDADFADEASAFLGACASLAPGERRELRRGSRLVAVVFGPRPEFRHPLGRTLGLWGAVSRQWLQGAVPKAPDHGGQANTQHLHGARRQDHASL